MPPRSNEFQELVYILKRHLSKEGAVVESRMLPDLITGAGREVDVCIEHVVAGHRVLVCLECRDTKRKATVHWVEQMKAKHDRLPTHALVLVSRSGFTKEAIRVAHAYGIETLSLESAPSEVVKTICGESSELWSRSYTLSPRRVILHVPEESDLPAEKVAVLKDTHIFGSDGRLICTAATLVRHLLQSHYIGRHILSEGHEGHKSFVVECESPTDRAGDPLYIEKIEPKRLRPIVHVYISGEVTFHASEFRLASGTLGQVNVVWASGHILEHPALLVASDTTEGRKVSLRVRGAKLKFIDVHNATPDSDN